MEALLTVISVFGAVVVLGFLVRNLLRRPSAIATAKFPSYTRLSYNMSHVVCLCCVVPWIAAALNTADMQIWKTLMLSPILLVLPLMLYAKRAMERQSPEVRDYAQDLAKDTWARRVIESRNRHG